MNKHKLLTLIAICVMALPTATHQEPLPQKEYVLAFDLHGVVFTPDTSLMWQAFKQTPFTFSSLFTLLNPFFIYDLVTSFFSSDSAEEIILHLTHNYPDLERYYETAMAMVNAQKPIPGTVKVLHQLKEEGYTLHVFSNIGKESLKFLRNNHPRIFQPFSDFVFTQPEDGWIQKPQPQAYKKFLQTVNLQPEQVIFIDDKKSNLKPAQDMGFVTIHFTSPETLRTTLQPYIGPLPTPSNEQRQPTTECGCY